jgi:phage gp46-like protein
MANKRGIAMPFAITPGAADIATAAGEELRRVHVETILGMRASSAGNVGEWAPDPDRGSKLDALRNAATSVAVEDFAVVYVEEALLQALPDERLREVAVTVDDRTIALDVTTQLAADASRNPRGLVVSKSIKRST